MDKILEKIGIWSLGIIPLIIGFIYILPLFGVQAVLADNLFWPLLVFFFGLLYTIGYFMK
jgi:hypothetical protein